ncbi:hypothetical protein CDCA_CDCA06G1801 [Cyanidium caldarium]|uniref:thioredoxin-dependent peroxiredoxin n=1 Tax=Cyanidium caldarium TaxID=2771 RepID=A0AAV9IUD3_CYACA|nr:hypothetical protein CDCA_CDCA06G1801 [Cyanidium caldarium]
MFILSYPTASARHTVVNASRSPRARLQWALSRGRHASSPVGASRWAPPTRTAVHRPSHLRMDVGEGDRAPDFTLQTASGESVSLSSYRGKPVLVYFYPKADTPGCTTQARDLNASLSELDAAGLTVIGVSRDPLPDLEAFRDKYNLQFPLASDGDGHVTEAYGVWKLRKMFGKEFMGIERSSFIVKDGKIVKAWRGVKSDQHLEWVKRSLKELDASAAP